MKNLINYSFKIGVLFTIAIFYISCQNEDDLNQEPNSQMIDNPIYNISTVSKHKINENLAVARVLNEITKPSKSEFNNYSRLVTYDNFNIVINDDYAKYLEKNDGSYHSYTFKAVDLDFPEKKKNLILSLKEDGSYKELLLNYYLTEQDFLSYSETGIIDFDTKIVSTLIDEDSYAIDIYSKTLGPTTDTPDCLSFIFDGTRCSGNNQHTWEERFSCDIFLAEQNGNNPSGTPPIQGPLVGIHIGSSCLGGNGSPGDTSPTGNEDTGQDTSSTGGGGDTSDNNTNSDYDPTDSDIHGNTVLAPIFDDECPLPDVDFIEQLNSILGEGNFDFDCDLANDEMMSINSIDDLEPFLDELFSNTFETTSSEMESPLSSIRRDIHKMEYSSFPKADIVASIKVSVPDDNNDLECLEILDVRTNLEGNTTLFDWTQLDSQDPTDSAGPLVEVDEASDWIKIFLEGELTVKLKIDEFPASIRHLITIVIVYRYSTGELIEEYSYWRPTF